jgi:hypothetical protein
MLAEIVPLIFTWRGRKYLRHVSWVEGHFGPDTLRSEWYAEQSAWRAL